MDIESIHSLWSAGADSYPAEGYFVFEQNNSGGYYVGPETVFIKASTPEMAWEILRKQDWFTTEHCECCGVRWMSPNNVWGTSKPLNGEVVNGLGIMYSRNGEKNHWFAPIRDNP